MNTGDRRNVFSMFHFEKNLSQIPRSSLPPHPPHSTPPTPAEKLGHEGARRLQRIQLTLHYSGEDFTLPPSLLRHPPPSFLSLPPSEPLVLGEMKAGGRLGAHHNPALSSPLAGAACVEEGGGGGGGRGTLAEQLQ